MVVLLVVAPLTGCGRIGFDELPECAAGSCTAPLDADLFDAPRGMAGVDTDGDGVNDDTDNCLSLSNPTQHDEDADGYGDVCDNCPTVANTSQANMGELTASAPADGVGDACDPRPTQPGDSIIYFEPFNEASLSSDWSIQVGTWTVGGDVATQASLLSDQRMHDVLTGVGPDYLVETKVTFTSFDTGNVNAGAVYRMTGGNGWVCSVFHDDTTTPVTSLLMLWTLQNGAANFERSRGTIPEAKVGDSFRLLAGAVGSNQYCALDSLQTGVTANFVSNKNASGVPGLRTNRTTNTYSYFLVYGLGGPP